MKSRISWPPSDGRPASSLNCLDTGEDTPTGGRVQRAVPALDSEPVCVTYADGVADLDLEALLGFHSSHDAPATMTVVRPRLPFGIADLGGDGEVRGFVEKPVSDHWVNGGFFCFDRPALEAIGSDSVLEREPLEHLAATGQLRAFRHEGFWACMDTYKDALELGDLWAQGRAPWKVWA